jgi:putative addiction module component (TIGR02574 family)
MSDSAKSILEAALKLSETERAELADALMESLPPDEDLIELTEEKFAAELDRRLADHDRDPSSAIPWSELKDMK